MTRIDLIPPEVIEKHKARQAITLIGLGFVVVFGILVAVYVILFGQVVMVNNRIAEIEKQDKQVRTYIDKLKPYEDRKKAMDERQAIIDKLNENHVQWSGILNDISMVLPNDIWLKSMTVDIQPILAAKEATTTQASSAGQAPEPPVRMIGYAFDHAAIARLLVHLSEVDQFRSVWLNYATEVDLAPSAAAATTTPTATTATGTAPTIKVIEFEATVQLSKYYDEAEAKKP